MKALVLYHANCNDGFGAAWAFNVLMEDFYDHTHYIPVSYNEPLPLEHVDTLTDVFILDFSYPATELVKCAEIANWVLVLDHHKTAQEALTPLIGVRTNLEIVFDMDRSGAIMTWDKFDPEQEEAPLFLQYIQDNDLWKFKFPETKAFISGLAMAEKHFDIWTGLCTSRELISMISMGETILEYRRTHMAAIIKATKQEYVIEGIQGLRCNAPYEYASDIGHILATESGTFGATWFQNSQGDIIYSLRSNGDFDVSALAKLHGGGGHKNAAGFKISKI